MYSDLGAFISSLIVTRRYTFQEICCKYRISRFTFYTIRIGVRKPSFLWFKCFTEHMFLTRAEIKVYDQLCAKYYGAVDDSFFGKFSRAWLGIIKSI